MPKRKLGKTGAEVSILCLGGMFDTLNNQLLLRQAYHWGVTYWDTAEGYGNGLSEDGFGRFFTRTPQSRKDIFMVTKYRTAPPDKLGEALDQAPKRLCTDYVDAFYTHGISDFNQIAGLRDWAEQAKKSGKIKFFGFSTHTNMEDCLLAAAKSGWIDSVMFTYNLKAVWENPNLASICSQMPNLAFLSANVAAARDLKALTKGDFDALKRFAFNTRSGYCAG